MCMQLTPNADTRQIMQLPNDKSLELTDDYLRDGATKEFAALCRMLTPIRRIKAALSCSKTNFTVVPDRMRHHMINPPADFLTFKDIQG